MRASGPRYHGFGRAQRLALIGGAAQLLGVLLDLTPLSTPAKLLQLASGLGGLYAAGSHIAARCYGAALVLVYGGMLVADLDTGPLSLFRAATLHEGRAAMLGLLIALIPRHGSHPVTRT